ncbi:hypothetical protein V1527DRAFT_521146 [Lipomyces starkeyi]
MQKSSNFCISTSSPVEGSRSAMTKINRRGNERSRQRRVIGQVETAMLCTVISRSALEMVISSCTINSRYLLPCSHRIQSGLPIDVRSIHPRWRLQVTLPPIKVLWADIDANTLTKIKDPAIAGARRGAGRPKGTQRIPTAAETSQRVADRIEKVRRCGSCNRVGHNRETCSKCGDGGEGPLP